MTQRLAAVIVYLESLIFTIATPLLCEGRGWGWVSPLAAIPPAVYATLYFLQHFLLLRSNHYPPSLAKFQKIPTLNASTN